MFRIKLFRITLSISLLMLFLGQNLFAFASRSPQGLKLEQQEIATSVIDTSRNRLVILNASNLSSTVTIKPDKKTLKNGRAVKIDGTLDSNGNLVIDLSRLGSAHLVPSGKYLVIAKLGKKILQSEFKIRSPKLVIGKLQVPTNSISNFDSNKEHNVLLKFQLYDLENNPLGQPTQVKGNIDGDYIKGTLIAERPTEVEGVVETRTQVTVDGADVGVWSSIAGSKVKARAKSRAITTGTNPQEHPTGTTNDSTVSSTTIDIDNATDGATHSYKAANDFTNQLAIDNNLKVTGKPENDLLPVFDSAVDTNNGTIPIPENWARSSYGDGAAITSTNTYIAVNESYNKIFPNLFKSQDGTTSPNPTPTSSPTSSNNQTSGGVTTATTSNPGFNVSIAIATFATTVPETFNDSPDKPIDISNKKPNSRAVTTFQADDVGLSIDTPNGRNVASSLYDATHAVVGSGIQPTSEEIKKSRENGQTVVIKTDSSLLAQTFKAISDDKKSKGQAPPSEIAFASATDTNLSNTGKALLSAGIEPGTVTATTSSFAILTGNSNDIGSNGAFSQLNVKPGTITSPEIAANSNYKIVPNNPNDQSVGGVPPGSGGIPAILDISILNSAPSGAVIANSDGAHPSIKDSGSVYAFQPPKTAKNKDQEEEPTTFTLPAGINFATSNVIGQVLSSPNKITIPTSATGAVIEIASTSPDTNIGNSLGALQGSLSNTSFTTNPNEQITTVPPETITAVTAGGGSSVFTPSPTPTSKPSDGSTGTVSGSSGFSGAGTPNSSPISNATSTPTPSPSPLPSTTPTPQTSSAPTQPTTSPPASPSHPM